MDDRDDEATLAELDRLRARYGLPPSSNPPDAAQEHARNVIEVKVRNGVEVTRDDLVAAGYPVEPQPEPPSNVLPFRRKER